jgi:hypothetical protein
MQVDAMISRVWTIDCFGLLRQTCKNNRNVSRHVKKLKLVSARPQTYTRNDIRIYRGEIYTGFTQFSRKKSFPLSGACIFKQVTNLNNIISYSIVHSTLFSVDMYLHAFGLIWKFPNRNILIHWQIKRTQFFSY